MKRRRFKIVAAGRDGVVAHYPMKDWLRDHPGHLPAGIDPGEHSHYIRDLLVQSGWQVEESSDEVRLYPPGSTPSPAASSPTKAQLPTATSPQPSPSTIAASAPTGDSVSRLQTVKLVVEIVGGMVAVIGAILALFLRSK